MRNRRLIKFLTPLSFTICVLCFILGTITLCYCPCFFYAAAAASAVPLLLGPKRLHRLVALVLFVLALATAKDMARREAEQNARVARVRAMAERQAATQRAATSSPASAQ